MEKLFETAIFTRSTLLDILEKMSYEELVKIPDNFRNSIFWNTAHLLVTQQLLFYRLSGLDLKIDEDMVKKYGKGSVAKVDVEESDILYVKEHLLALMKTAKADYLAGRFNAFKSYTTSPGIELKSIDDAILFSAYHDGIHLGIILSLLKIV